MADEETIFLLSDFFKNFGDSTRVKIMGALFNGEMCVGTIADVLNMTQSAVSHQLRVLKASRLVKARKEGKLVYYSLNDDHIKMIYKMGIEHILE
ncbi:MAG: metalloregulator ArsR/SmtB family transcription factor [Vallitalea sp.]|nr:metalloregulator ArsR/SmtB family transcription factor [Vallitalea sp.]